MFFEHRAFWLAKDTAQPEQYQDAFAVDDFRGVAAVADGVSSSLFAGSWAKILCDAVISDPPDIQDEELLSPWLDLLRSRWLEPIDVEALAWHQKPKFQQGAQTTLLWVEFYSDEDLDKSIGEVDLYAYGVGDCCLFHVRDNQTLRSFPLLTVEEFAEDPGVIGSINQKKDQLIPFADLRTTCVDGDLIVLASDALAAWGMGLIASGQPNPWPRFWTMSPEEFEQTVVELRESQKIRYDDTTLLLLKLGKPQQSENGSEQTDVASN